MNFDALLANLPMIAYVVCATGFFFFLRRYKRENDLQAWLAGLRAVAERAIKDEDFRRAQLADANAELADCPVPERIVPLKRNQELFVHLLPKFIFGNGIAAAVILFFGIFRPAPAGETNAMLYLGVALMGMIGFLFLLSEKMRRDYRRVRQLNRKYLLLKTGNDFPAMLAALSEVLEYYPSVPELWLEYADRLALGGKLDQAVAAIRKARELSPGHLDLAVVELSFLIRKNDRTAAEKILSAMPDMKPAASDPRPSIYAAALELQKNNREKAWLLAEKAMELDGDFVKNFLFRDETLAEVQNLLRDKGLLAEKEEEKAAE